MYKKITCHTVILLFFFVQAKTQNFVFAQLTGSPMNTSGWNLQGAAKVTNIVGTGDSELLLVPNANGLSGAAFFNQPINLSMCNNWRAEFDYRLYDGTAADGLAFCFLDVPPVGFVTGFGLGIPGTANGLKVCFDTYNNCNASTTYEMPKVEIRWGVGYSECWSQPTAVNEGGYLSFIRSPTYNHAVIAYDSGNITVTVNGKQIITGYQQFTFPGYLGFTGSTGGQNDNESIKNVVIYTQMPPSVAGKLAAPVCPGDTVKLGTANNTSYSYSWSPSAGLSNTTISNPYAVTSNNTGNILYQKYFVSTSFTNNPGCASQDSVVVQVNPSPLTAFTVPVICLPNGSVTIKNQTAINDGTQNQISYKWAFSDGGTSTQTNPQHNYATPGNYSISLNAVSSYGCADSISQSFTVSPQAVASISFPAQLCADTAVAFAGSSGGAAVQKWSWNFGDNTTDSVQNPNHTYTAANVYTVTLSAVTTQGCVSDTASTKITINPLPIANFTVTGLSCQNQQLRFTDVSVASVGTDSTRSWSLGDGTTSTAQAFNHSFSQYGQHTVTLTVQNSAGCFSKPDTQTITVNPAPVANFIPPVACIGMNGTFIDSSSIPDGTQGQFTYQWFFGDGSTATGNKPTHAYFTAGTDTARLVVTSNKGCTDTVAKLITISPRAKMVITLPAQFCADSSVAFSSGAGGAIVQAWAWKFGDNGTDSVQNPSHTYATANTYTVTLTAVTNQGCLSDTATASITINPLPAANFTVNGTSCQNQQLQFTDVSSPSVGTEMARSWYLDDGTTSTLATFNHSFAKYGQHTVTLTVQNSAGCFSKADTQTLTINPLPVANFGPPTICVGVNGSFTDSSTIADGTQNQFGYQWYFGDGSTGTGGHPSHTYTPAGDYTASLVVTSNKGCSDSVAKTFAVSGYPDVNFAILTTNFCGDLPLQLQDNSSVAFGALDYLKILWNFPATPDSSEINNPVPGTVYTHNYPTFGYTGSKQVSVVVQAYSTGGCYSEKTSSSILFASPKLVFSPIPTFCQNINQGVLLNEAKDTSAFGGSGFYTGTAVNNGYFTPSEAGPGQYTITYTYTLVNGCTDSLQQTVTVAVQPTVSAGQSTVILRGGQIVLDGSASGGSSLTYSWSPGSSLSDSTALQPTATPTDDTYYTLTATNSDGCADSAGVLIKVLQYPEVPNAFSPNGDGINDTWQIAYLSSYPDCKVEVFNRYGQLVFSSEGYQTPWDGTVNGKPLPVATYYYIISTKHLPKPLSGSITILR